MTVRAKIINEIIDSVDKIPENQLKEILAFVKTVEKNSSSKDSILSFAGKWKNLDKDVFDTLTKDLHSNRKKDIRTID